MIAEPLGGAAAIALGTTLATMLGPPLRPPFAPMFGAMLRPALTMRPLGMMLLARLLMVLARNRLLIITPQHISPSQHPMRCQLLLKLRTCSAKAN